MMGSPVPLSGLLHSTTLPVMLTRLRSSRWASQSDVSNSSRPTSVIVRSNGNQLDRSERPPGKEKDAPNPLSFVNLVIEFHGAGLTADLLLGVCSRNTSRGHGQLEHGRSSGTKDRSGHDR